MGKLVVNRHAFLTHKVDQPKESVLLCGDCEATENEGPPAHEINHAELQKYSTVSISSKHPMYCDNCGEAIIAYDTP